ncbi:TetR/AcrR family transcriptional regulator [Saccharomonospora azurea]|uniref:Transcriptional regulator n=1 Tax=Saccharomonospora azurea NA-128 TaxID=882081 RepID=H8GDP5_9PSEU|nr:TetR family transcriptional regulator [Saccharomonospora azurea]EHY87890.1 transcriptional regulator [Saccharomonospora azurea NA-128]
MAVRTIRSERANATRRRILDTAERLFAEHGVTAVSNRQISEAAGQGNNTAVGYHFGTKVDLVRAIVRRHNEQIERRRLDMVERAAGSSDPRDWVACLVHPLAEHLAESGSPTWFARFGAQVTTDPSLRPIMYEETLSSPSLLHILEQLHHCLPELPVEVRLERGDMTRQLIVHMLAERERALAELTTTPRASWCDAATGLVDAIVGLWSAPATPRRRPDDTDTPEV